MNYFLYVMLLILFLIVLILALSIRKIKKQIKDATAIVKEIAKGNLDRRIVIDETSPVATLCYQMNDLVIKTKFELIKHQQSEHAYRKLVTSLSHDIRTPLASLTGHLEAIQLNVVAEEEKEQYIDITLKKAFDLQNYIDTLFEWLKLESGERIYYYEETDILELIREIIAEWIPRLDQANIEYDIAISEEKVIAKVDQTAIKRVIDNLIQNVFLHSQATNIKIEAKQENNKLSIKLSDNGVGIAKTDLPYVFDRLYKCNTARGVSGNGLGLSIVKELVRGLQGEIALQSEEEHGTEFAVSIPILNH